jgi:hypothetical protein
LNTPFGLCQFLGLDYEDTRWIRSRLLRRER